MSPASTSLRLTAALTPHGRLVVVPQDDAPALEAALATRICSGFDRGSGHGLLRLGGAEVGQALPPVFAYWRELGSRFVTALCTRPDADERVADLPPPPDDLEARAASAPPMPGGEYLAAGVLRDLWTATAEAFTTERAETGLALQDFLKRLSPAWNVVGRVHFNLAENRKDEQAPFALPRRARGCRSRRSPLPKGGSSRPMASRSYSGSTWSNRPTSPRRSLLPHHGGQPDLAASQSRVRSPPLRRHRVGPRGAGHRRPRRVRSQLGRERRRQPPRRSQPPRRRQPPGRSRVRAPGSGLGPCADGTPCSHCARRAVKVVAAATSIGEQLFRREPVSRLRGPQPDDAI